MRHAFFPARKTFMWTILKYYLIVILTLSLALIFYQNFFYRINNTNATNLSRMMELQNFSHGVSAMYDNVQNYVSRNSAEYRENFSNIYKETLPVIEQLQQEYQTSDTYIYRDIRAIFETYYKNGTSLMDNADIYRDATFFLTSDLISLEKLMNYLHEEVYLGIEHMLTESNEFVYATLEAQNRTHILLNTAVFIFVILCVIFSWNISRYIAAPISQLSTKFQKVAGGCLQIRAEQERKNCVEINMLIDSFNLMVEKLRKSGNGIETSARTFE